MFDGNRSAPICTFIALVTLCASQARAQDSAAYLPLINEGVASSHAVQIDHGIRAAIANQRESLQGADHTVAIVEGARASGLTCDLNLVECAIELGALANAPTVFVARILKHQERGYWVEIRRIDVVKNREVHVRRTAITLDDPAFSDALNALVTSVMTGDEVNPDLRGPEAVFPLDLTLYATAGGLGTLGVVTAVGAGGLLVAAYNLSGRKVNTIAESENDVNTVRTLSTTAVVLAVGSVVLVGTAIATAAAGGAVSANLFEE